MKRILIGIVFITQILVGCGVKETTEERKEVMEGIEKMENESEVVQAPIDVPLEDSIWNMTEEEKQASYEEFCKERHLFLENKPKNTLRRCIWSAKWNSNTDADVFRVMVDDPEKREIYLEETISDYANTGDTILAVIEGKRIVMYEYDGTRHDICLSDELITDIRSMTEYSIFQTESGKVYRVHHFSGIIDLLADLGQENKLSFPYDSESFTFHASEESEFRSLSPYATGLLFFDVETGISAELPEEMEKANDALRDNNDIIKENELRNNFDAGYFRFVPSTRTDLNYVYELDEEGNLSYWDKKIGKSSAVVTDRDVDAMYIWNEYVYYIQDFNAYCRINGEEGRMLVDWLPAYLPGPFEIVGNDEYIYYVCNTEVYRYHIELDYGLHFCSLEEGAHNIRIYDNMSFLWDDAEGNAHYYSHRTRSELPIPEDWVEY